MTDYWKSNAKIFCPICKSWYADNKVSAENHERGLKHKAMVQQRLRESTRKAQEKERQQEELQNTLRQMEYAAMASMSNDERERIAQEPSSVKTAGPSLPSKKEIERMEFKAQKRKLEQLKRTAGNSQFWEKDGQNADVNDGDLLQEDSEPLAVEKEWVQAMHETGQVYYWHVYTGETRWEMPSDCQFFTTEEYSQRYAEIVAQSATYASYSTAASGSQAYTPESTSTTIKQEEEAKDYEIKKADKHDDLSTKKEKIALGY